jgi:hypothetical protein
MRIQDGIKLKGKIVEIPDSSRDELPRLFKELNYKVGAEIGVHKGAFTEKFCQAGLTMYAIDPWTVYKGIGWSPSQSRLNFLYDHTQRALAPYKNCTIIRATSMDALQHFTDGSLDFVYIDADHEFGHIAQDLAEWSKKVRRGGAVSGHDYFYLPPGSEQLCQVGPVVDAYVKSFEIDNLYVFGKTNIHTDNNDLVPSWMFFKP